jgi:hypothetical protein
MLIVIKEKNDLLEMNNLRTKEENNAKKEKS